MSDKVVDSEVIRAAGERFRMMFDPEEIDAMQEHSPAAVYTPYVTVALMVLQRIRENATLEDAVSAAIAEGFFAALPGGDRRLMSAGNGAFSRARTRLDLELAEAVCDRVFDLLVAAAPPSFAGRRAFAIDGSTFSLSSDEKLRTAYPPAPNQHGKGVWPIMYAAVAYELSSGCAVRPEIGAMFGENRVSEIALSIRLLDRIPPDSIVIGDRNFGIFRFGYEARRKGRHFVTRLMEKRFLALRRDAKRIGEGRWELDWRPSAWDRKHHPEIPADAVLPVHLHEVDAVDERGRPTKLWLATTLTDVEADGATWAELYRRRWAGENDVRNVKVAMEMDELRGRSDSMVRKELALGTAAYNLVIQVRRIAARAAKAEPRDLSFKGTWSLVRELLAPRTRAPEEYLRVFEIVIRGAGQRKLPKRPGRHNPRTVLPRAQKYPKRKPGKPAHEPV
jgi:hypothetical protein